MTDDDLRARLRRADPAASLTPIAPDQVSHLLEETMSTTTTQPTAQPTTQPTTQPAAARRRRMTVLAAAVFVLIAAVAGSVLLRPQHHDSTPPSSLGLISPSGQPITTHLTAAGGGAKCKPPTADILASTPDFAFAGTVTAVAGPKVTLLVSHVYKGAAADSVEIAQMGDSSEGLMGGSKFTVGTKYLIASANGGVMICGYSGVADAFGLADLYAKAF